MAFLYRYKFAAADDAKALYRGDRVKEIYVVRTTFKVVSVYGADKTIDSEEFFVSTIDDHEWVYGVISERLNCYFMPDGEIKCLIDGAFELARQMKAGGRRGKIPVAADLEVCTVQQDGETIEETEDRAMKIENLPPLHIYRTDWNDADSPDCHALLMCFLSYDLGKETIRVEDVEEAMRVMDVCSVCGRKPTVGTQISRLRCGHVFHYHCIVRRLEVDISCPICKHPAWKKDEELSEEEFGLEFGPPASDSDGSELNDPAYWDYDEVSLDSDDE